MHGSLCFFIKVCLQLYLLKEIFLNHPNNHSSCHLSTWVLLCSNPCKHMRAKILPYLALYLVLETAPTYGKNIFRMNKWMNVWKAKERWTKTWGNSSIWCWEISPLFLKNWREKRAPVDIESYQKVHWRPSKTYLLGSSDKRSLPTNKNNSFSAYSRYTRIQDQVIIYLKVHLILPARGLQRIFGHVNDTLFYWNIFQDSFPNSSPWSFFPKGQNTNLFPSYLVIFWHK